MSRIKKTRNRYIDEAVECYNKLHRKQFLEKKLKKESGLVKEESIAVLKDFEEM